MNEFRTAAELSSFLRGLGVEPARWPFKTVDDLWRELAERECTMETTVLRRLCGVVRLTIRRGRRMLKEYKEVKWDGRSRDLDRRPSEKMLPGESWRNAAVRCVGEELEVRDSNCVHILDQTYRMKTYIEESESYWGVLSVYPVHSVELRIAGLPSSDFSTEEEADEGVVRHYWRWVKEVTVPEE